MHSQASSRTFNLAWFIVSFVYFTHFAACGFFYVGKVQYEEDPNGRYDNRTWFITFHPPNSPDYHKDYQDILDLPIFE
jgi:hypothetical protein